MWGGSLKRFTPTEGSQSGSGLTRFTPDQSGSGLTRFTPSGQSGSGFSLSGLGQSLKRGVQGVSQGIKRGAEGVLERTIDREAKKVINDVTNKLVSDQKKAMRQVNKKVKQAKKKAGKKAKAVHKKGKRRAKDLLDL